jgi:hypothetical protein
MLFKTINFDETFYSRDHANGNPELVNSLKEKIPVYGGDDLIPALTNKVNQNDSFKVYSTRTKPAFRM